MSWTKLVRGRCIGPHSPALSTTWSKKPRSLWKSLGGRTQPQTLHCMSVSGALWSWTRTACRAMRCRLLWRSVSVLSFSLRNEEDRVHGRCSRSVFGEVQTHIPGTPCTDEPCPPGPRYPFFPPIEIVWRATLRPSHHRLRTWFVLRAGTAGQPAWPSMPGPWPSSANSMQSSTHSCVDIQINCQDAGTMPWMRWRAVKDTIVELGSDIRHLSRLRRSLHIFLLVRPFLGKQEALRWWLAQMSGNRRTDFRSPQPFAGLWRMVVPLLTSGRFQGCDLMIATTLPAEHHQWTHPTCQCSTKAVAVPGGGSIARGGGLVNQQCRVPIRQLHREVAAPCWARLPAKSKSTSNLSLSALC